MPCPRGDRTSQATGCLPRSAACTATLSGAVCAGSNPAGGAGQMHKTEHSVEQAAAAGRVCDLRKRTAFLIL
jgi:hypothetical protein